MKSPTRREIGLRRIARRFGRRHRPSVLVVDRAVPTPDQDAGSRTMFQILRLFRRAGFAVHFFAPRPRSGAVDPAYVERLEALGVVAHRLDPRPFAGLKAWLPANGETLDCVFLSRPGSASRVLPLVWRHTAAPVLYYGHDIYHRRLDAQSRHTDDETAGRAAARLEALETALWAAVDTVYYPTAEDCRSVEERCRAAGVAVDARVLPVFGFESFGDDGGPPSPAGRGGAMFVGGFRHAPNVDGMLWFADAIWPLIARGGPETRLSIIGSFPPDPVLALAGDRIAVTGFVPDDALDRAYRAARVVVAPLRFGGGMKGKIVEALRWGVPVVTTTVGAQGFDGSGGAIAVADEPDGFAGAVLRLLGDDRAWLAAATAAVAFARAHFSEDAMWAAIAASL
jgi:glycosyltransferase involved in cell wall biosynthesis